MYTRAARAVTSADIGPSLRSTTQARGEPCGGRLAQAPARHLRRRHIDKANVRYGDGSTHVHGDAAFFDDAADHW